MPSLNEIARSSHVGIEIEESLVPIAAPVRAAREILGLDPLHVANERKLVAIVSAKLAGELLDRMRHHPLGRNAAGIGQVTERNAGMLTARTAIGGTRLISIPRRKQFPRIC